MLPEWFARRVISRLRLPLRAIKPWWSRKRRMTKTLARERDSHSIWLLVIPAVSRRTHVELNKTANNSSLLLRKSQRRTYTRERERERERERAPWLAPVLYAVTSMHQSYSGLSLSSLSLLSLFSLSFPSSHFFPSKDALEELSKGFSPLHD